MNVNVYRGNPGKQLHRPLAAPAARRARLGPGADAGHRGGASDTVESEKAHHCGPGIRPGSRPEVSVGRSPVVSRGIDGAKRYAMRQQHVDRRTGVPRTPAMDADRTLSRIPDTRPAHPVRWPVPRPACAHRGAARPSRPPGCATGDRWPARLCPRCIRRAGRSPGDPATASPRVHGAALCAATGDPGGRRPARTRSAYRTRRPRAGSANPMVIDAVARHSLLPVAPRPGPGRPDRDRRQGCLTVNLTDR